MPYRYHPQPQSPPTPTPGGGATRRLGERPTSPAEPLGWEERLQRFGRTAAPTTPAVSRLTRQAPRSTSQPASSRRPLAQADPSANHHRPASHLRSEWWSQTSMLGLQQQQQQQAQASPSQSYAHQQGQSYRDRLEQQWGLRREQPSSVYASPPSDSLWNTWPDRWGTSGRDLGRGALGPRAGSEAQDDQRREVSAGRPVRQASTPRAGGTSRNTPAPDWYTRSGPAANAPAAARGEPPRPEWAAPPRSWSAASEAQRAHQPQRIIYSMPQDQPQQQPAQPAQCGQRTPAAAPAAATGGQQQQQQQQESGPVPPAGGPFLPQQPIGSQGLFTLVLDLDETLVHSSFDPSPADLVFPIVIDGEEHSVYVRKRPHMEYFLRKCCELFEVVVWTASLSVYAEPLIEQLVGLSGKGLTVHRLFRDHCSEYMGGYVKDLSQLGRTLERVAIVDNSPSAALMQPRNLIGISSWYDDVTDTALLKLLPMLERLSKCQSCYEVLAREGSQSWSA